MKGYVTNGKGIDSIRLEEREAPRIESDHDVLVEVKACSLNYRDLMIAKGEYQYAPKGAEWFIPLSDMAGVVLEVGKKVSEFKKGDRVLNSPFRHWPAGRLRPAWANTFIGTSTNEGVFAAQIVYPEDSLVKIPPHLNFEEASTFTIAGLTAWAALVPFAKARVGEWVLLQGTGGVSTFAAKLAQGMGLKTIMTTSNPEKGEIVKREIGVHATVNYRDPDWTKQVKEISGGVDIVLDVTGGETLANSIAICNFGARVAVIGVLSNPESTIQIRHLLRHQVTLKGIFMESTEELRAFMRAVETLKLKPHVDRVFPFNQALEAYRYFNDQKHVGKVVISMLK
jgi:NADPH:quinone reductase-like Zn-dependent oxidoreductase